MGPRGAIEIIYGKEIKEAADQDAMIKEKEEEYRDKFATPYIAAQHGYVDDVIEPRNTRFRVIRALESLATKRDMNPPKKHGSIPL